MTRSRRDPAELAAAIEQGVARGLDLVDSWRIATGKAPKSSSRALQAEHRKALEANRRTLTRHRVRERTYRSQATGGAVVAGVGGALGLIDVVAETA